MKRESISHIREGDAEQLVFMLHSYCQAPDVRPLVETILYGSKDCSRWADFSAGELECLKKQLAPNCSFKTEIKAELDLRRNQKVIRMSV